MRYVAARCATLRLAEAAWADIELQKCNTTGNSAGGFTKSVTGLALARSRANILGNDLPPM
jgi:hypothetical protein